MMKKVLVAYTTMSGSTAEVARAVGAEIASQGLQVEVLPLEKVTALMAYDAVVLGAPMVMGWHPSALKFLAKNRLALSRLPLALFVMALSLTSTGETELHGVPVCIDEKLAKPPQKPGRPSLGERHAFVYRYAAPILKSAAPARPVSIAFFGGKLDYFHLKPLARLFVMLVIQARPGDWRNWETIRSWAGRLPRLFIPSES
jgi:menaquinone-dependent protoporphyrinogen IX oxidase